MARNARSRLQTARRTCAGPRTHIFRTYLRLRAARGAGLLAMSAPPRCLRFPRSTQRCTPRSLTMLRGARKESSMSSSSYVLAVALLVVTSVFLPGSSAVAESDSVWEVKQRLVGKGGEE